VNAALLILACLVFLVRWHGALGDVGRGLAGIIPVRDQGLGVAAVQFAGSLVLAAAAALAALGVARAGRRFVRWTGLNGPAGIVSAAAGVAAASAAALGLGLAGLAGLPVAAVAWLSCAALGLREAGRERTRPPVLFLLLALVPLAAAVVPETEVDACVYHLALPQAYARAHKVFLTPGSFLDGYWQGQEVLAWPALALGSETAAKLVSFFAALLAAAAAGALALRFGGHAAGVWAAAAVLAAPAVVAAAGHAKNDALAAGLIGACLVVRSGGTTPARALLAGILCGAAAGVRTSAAIALPALAATYLTGRGRWKLAALALAGGAVPALPWLFRNGLELGNPVFPLLVGRIPTLGMASLDRALSDEYLRTWANAFPRGVWEGAAAAVTVFGGAVPAAAAGLFVLPWTLRGPGSFLAVFAAVFGALWIAVFPWMGRFALPAALPLSVLGCAWFAREPSGRRLGILGWASVAGSMVVLVGLAAEGPRPAGCAVGLESREGFSRRFWGNWWEAARAIEELVPANERVLAVGEWKSYPVATRVVARWIADAPPVWQLARDADSVGRMRIRLRQRRVTHVLHNLPQAGFWARYAARFPWEPAAVARWRKLWDGSATLRWRSRDQDPRHGFLLLSRLSRGALDPPFRGWLPGTEGEFHALRLIVARSFADPAADRELDRAERLLGPRAEIFARRGCLLALRHRDRDALNAFRAAVRAAPEARPVWSMYGAVSIRTPEELARYARGFRDTVDTGFVLGIPVALGP